MLRILQVYIDESLHKLTVVVGSDTKNLLLAKFPETSSSGRPVFRADILCQDLTEPNLRIQGLGS